jgi:hypothetical protein
MLSPPAIIELPASRASQLEFVNNEWHAVRMPLRAKKILPKHAATMSNLRKRIGTPADACVIAYKCIAIASDRL